MNLEQRITELEQRIAELEKKATAETAAHPFGDSENGTCVSLTPIANVD